MTEEDYEELAKQIVEKVIKPRDSTSVFYTPYVETIKHAIRQAWWNGYAEGVNAARWGRGVAEEMVQEEERTRRR